MFRLLVLIMILGFLYTNSNAQCTKDIECKGDRICVDGKCISPEDIENTTYQTESEAPIITKLSNEQKKRVAGAVLLNGLIPFVNAGHIYNSDNIPAGILAAGTFIPVSIALINWIAAEHAWSSYLLYDENYKVKVDNELFYSDKYWDLYSENRKATAQVIGFAIFSGTVHVVSTIIAGIRRSKIEKGIIQRKNVSIVPVYELKDQKTSLNLVLQL